MSDEENLSEAILALAGDSASPPKTKVKEKVATTSSRSNKGKPPRKKKRTIEEDELSEQEFDEEQASEEDQELSYYSSSSSESGFEDIYGADLMGDEEDRRKLSAMTEVERESILQERAEKRQLFLERQEIRKKLKAGRKLDLSHRRSHPKNTEKIDKLKELKYKRDQRKIKDNEVTEHSSKRKHSPSFDKRQEDDYEDGIMESERHIITLNELQKAQITRNQLEKWAFAPFFERTVIGCFARLSLGPGENNQPVYRVTEIVDVVEYHRTYKLGKTLCKTALKLKHGKAEKVFLMDIISNAPFNESEYDRFVKTLKIEAIPLPTLEAVLEKEGDLKKAEEHVLSHSELEYMISKKKELALAPSNIAHEKIMLNRAKELALQKNDLEEVKRINVELEQLVKMNEPADERLNKLTEINKRNRRTNMLESQQAGNIAAMEKKKRGQNALDPFARRKCMPTSDDIGDEITSPEIENVIKVYDNPHQEPSKSNPQMEPPPLLTQKRFEEALAILDTFDIEV